MSAPENPRLDARKVRFESLTRTETGFDLKATDDPDNGVILGMAEAMAALLGSATNYVECEVIPSVGSDIKGSYTMTVQRRNHPTPHELRRKAEQERDDLQARWDARHEAVRALITQWRGGMQSTHYENGAWTLERCIKELTRIIEGGSDD